MISSPSHAFSPSSPRLFLPLTPTQENPQRHHPMESSQTEYTASLLAIALSSRGLLMEKLKLRLAHDADVDYAGFDVRFHLHGCSSLVLTAEPSKFEVE